MSLTLSVKGLLDGQRVILINDQAEVSLHLSVSDKVKPGLLYVPKRRG